MILTTLAAVALIGVSTTTSKPPAVRVIDGDTVAIGPERIRLMGIDAPEMPGHCRRGRVCARGDGPTSKAVLDRFLRGGAGAGRYSSQHAENGAKVGGVGLLIQRFGTDRYGRTLAIVRVGGVNLSCAQLRAGQAIYKRQWDQGGRVRRECPEVAR